MPRQVLLTEDELWDLVLRACRQALAEQWVDDQEVARRLGITVRVWRLRYQRDKALLDKSRNVASEKRPSRRWRLADVMAHLGIG